MGPLKKIEPKILKGEVPVLISVPDGYDIASTNYPVLYDLGFNFTYDCGTVEFLARGSYIPNMIVVGVPPLQRRYVPTPFEERGEGPAGADLSVKFLREELIPFVEKNYRTNSFRILHGHSVGGLFTNVFEFQLVHPNIFASFHYHNTGRLIMFQAPPAARARSQTPVLFLVNYNNQVTAANLHTFISNEKTTIVFSPFFSHVTAHLHYFKR